MRVVPPARRVAVAFVAWIGLEAMFFMLSGVSRAAVQRAVGPDFRDVVLAPAPGNPLCLSAIVVTEGDGVYGVTRAAVAPLPEVLDVSACRPSGRIPQGDPSSGRSDSRGIRWGAMWTAPVAELRSLSRSHCEVAAALRFIRVPVWRALPDGGVMFSDVRFGEGEDGFASIVTRSEAPCPKWVPDWEWPRQDILGKAPSARS